MRAFAVVGVRIGRIGMARAGRIGVFGRDSKAVGETFADRGWSVVAIVAAAAGWAGVGIAAAEAGKRKSLVEFGKRERVIVLVVSELETETTMGFAERPAAADQKDLKE